MQGTWLLINIIEYLDIPHSREMVGQGITSLGKAYLNIQYFFFFLLLLILCTQTSNQDKLGNKYILLYIFGERLGSPEYLNLNSL